MTDKKAQRVLRRKTLASLLGISETTLWRRVRAGLVPPPVQFGNGQIGWLESTIADWQESLPTIKAG